MNRHLKRIAERLLVRSPVARVAQARLSDSSLLVLAYHDIVPSGSRCTGATSLHLSQRQFGEQLDMICQVHEVVSLAAAVCEPVSVRPRVAITFDDAYAGALTAGVEELERRQLPATVFVTPTLLGQTTWWDVLASHSEGVVGKKMSEHALWELAGDRDDVLHWFSRHAVSISQSQLIPRIGTLAELRAVDTYPLLSIGAHTWTHANLCAVTDEELERELTLPLAWLKPRFTKFIPMLSYPYGLCSKKVELAASRAGYVRAFRVDGGWIVDPSTADPFAMSRFNVAAGLSMDGLRLRLAGIGAAW